MSLECTPILYTQSQCRNHGTVCTVQIFIENRYINYHRLARANHREESPVAAAVYGPASASAPPGSLCGEEFLSRKIYFLAAVHLYKLL